MHRGGTTALTSLGIHWPAVNAGTGWGRLPVELGYSDSALILTR